ncbi:hypothetical protein HAX54_014859, partial [Datura stramonium]|nr:hypothetical protein [Datura stramonium]
KLGRLPLVCIMPLVAPKFLWGALVLALERSNFGAVARENSVEMINLPSEEMIEAQRTEATRLAEEAQLAEVARRAEAMNFIAALGKLLWLNELPDESIDHSQITPCN